MTDKIAQPRVKEPPKPLDKQLSKVHKSEQRALETLAAVLMNDTLTEAAKHLGITYRGLQKRLDRYELRTLLAELPTYALGILQQGSLTAAKKLVKAAASQDKEERQWAIDNILDRTSVGTSPTNTRQPTINLSFNQHVQEQKDKYGL